MEPDMSGGSYQGFEKNLQAGKGYWVVATNLVPAPGSFSSSMEVTDGSSVCVVASTLEEHDRLTRFIEDCLMGRT